MDINSAEIYLKKNEKKLLAGGQSGARVYDIGGEYVLKQIYREEELEMMIYMKLTERKLGGMPMAVQISSVFRRYLT